MGVETSQDLYKQEHSGRLGDNGTTATKGRAGETCGTNENEKPENKEWYHEEKQSRLHQPETKSAYHKANNVYYNQFNSRNFRPYTHQPESSNRNMSHKSKKILEIKNQIRQLIEAIMLERQF